MTQYTNKEIGNDKKKQGKDRRQPCRDSVLVRGGQGGLLGGGALHAVTCMNSNSRGKRQVKSLRREYNWLEKYKLEVEDGGWKWNHGLAQGMFV